MSLGYAEKLSFREDLGGSLGAPEHYDTAADLETKVDRLAQLIRQAKRVVAFTGAGISTSCGIPDFRGPSGIWTLQRAGQPAPKPLVSFTHATPSLTHQVLLALMRSGKLTYLVSQNVDGLHLRSGVPRAQLAELHGNCFAERCGRCTTEYVRDFEVETVGFKRTGRRCSAPGCGGVLHDHILDWEDELPPDELAASEEHAREADMAICLGTSLQITPACNLPLKATRTYKGGNKQEPGKLAILNLQKTQHDAKAAKSGGVVIHSRCDEVMRSVAAKLGLQIPDYVRQDTVLVAHQQQHSSSSSSSSSNKKRSTRAPEDSSGQEEQLGQAQQQQLRLPFSVSVQSPHGPKCAMPMVQRVDIAFEDPLLAPASMPAPPFSVRRTAERAGQVGMRITLHLHPAADADKRTVSISHTITLAEQPLAGAASLERREVHFITQVVDYGCAKAEESAEGAAGQPAAEAAAAATAVHHELSEVYAVVTPDDLPATMLSSGPTKRQRLAGPG